MRWKAIGKISLALNLFIILFLIGKRLYFSNRQETPSQSAEFLNTMRNDAFADLPIDSSDIVLVGTSMTEGLFLNEMLNDGHILNRGIGGNTSRMMAARISKIAEGHPRTIFLEMGICDLFFHISLDTFARYFDQTIQNIRTTSPGTRIIVQSILPVGDAYADLRPQLERFNDFMKAACIRQHLTYIDLFTTFQENGRLNPEYDMDGIHLNGRGYARWAEQLIQKLGAN